MPPLDFKERIKKEWKNLIGILGFCVLISVFMMLNDDAKAFERNILILYSSVAGLFTIIFGIGAFIAFSAGKSPMINIVRIVVLNALMLIGYNACIHVYNDNHGTNLEERDSLKQDTQKSD